MPQDILLVEYVTVMLLFLCFYNCALTTIFSGTLISLAVIKVNKKINPKSKIKINVNFLVIIVFRINLLN